MRVLLLLPLFLIACSTQPPDTKVLVHYDASEDGAADELEAARDAQAEDFAERAAAAQVPTMRFARVELSPEEPRIDDVIEAEARLHPGASPFTEIAFTWYVNGRDVIGVTDSTLDRRKGRFKKFDRVKVIAMATDENGGMTQMASQELLIANSTPTITTDISRQSGLNGLRLKAEDPDGDSLVWSITQGPPGVTINSRGVLRVDMRDLAEDYHGEVVIVVEDPDGARAELHVPVNVNAAEAGHTKEEIVVTGRGRMEGTLQEYADAQKDAVGRIDKMTSEEFEKYMDDQEKKAYK